MKKKRIGRKMLCLIVSLVMIMTLIPRTSMDLAYAAAGDVPAHSKTLTDNHDGTYNLALTIKGENEKIVNRVNVIVILDVSSSMNTSAGGGNTRLSAAKSAVNNLANTLLSLNGQGDNPNDAVEMALVTFGNTATTLQSPTTSASTFTSRVSGITIPTGVGTNWEAAMQEGNRVSFNDDNQTFVIFVSDGNPTFRFTEGNYPNHNNDYNADYYRDYGVWGSGSDSGQGSATTIARCYEHAVDDATTLATKVGGTNFYTIGAYGNVDRMQSLTTEAGAPASNYFSATNTTQLQEALAAILEDIQTAGIGAASINDPTTTDVVVSSDVTAHLLTVDKNSFKYYKNGVEWADAPPASLDENGNVVWDLKSVGILDNDVTYQVTFDVWPTQETYDMIADLENGDLDYETGVPDAVKEYLIQNEDGSYTLRTNKDFPSITYTDTRTDDGPQTVSYTNPEPVPTEVSEMDVSKVWFNDLDDRGAQEYPNGFTMDLTRDDKVCDAVTVKPTDWSDKVYISTGLMRVHKDENGAITGIEVLEDGHDYTLVEPENMQYRWELVVETIHPMLINGQLTSLVEVLPEDIPEAMGDADFYTLAGVNFYRLNNGKVYKENGQGNHASVSAYNERKSNLNLTKVVDGDDAPKDELFEYTITVTDPNGDDLWFSVVTDPEDPDNTLVKDLETTATAEVRDGANTGYYYFSSGSSVTVKMQAGWNLRFTNLPTGTTYTIVETTTGMSTGFTFDSVNGDTQITVSELPDGAVDMGDGTYSYNGIIYTGNEADGYTYTYKPTVDGAKVNGKVVAPNGSYQVTYTNLYSFRDVEITKVWEDNEDQDGIRPTAEEFKSYLKLLADGTDVTAANADKLEVTENENGTFTAKWTAVQRFKENTTTKEEITYTVEETEIPGYTTEGSPANNGGTITNSHEPEETEVTVLKVWDDSDDIGKIRPTSIQVQLTADGEAKGDPVTLNEDNEWTYTWEELPVNKEGKEIEYKVDETAVPAGYTKTVTGDATTGYTITNTYNPTPVSVNPPVQKIIENNDDLYNKGDFTFTIAATSPTNAPMPAITSITNSSDYEVEGKTGFYAFGAIEFTKPGTYTYKVTESGEVDGVTNDPAAETGKTITFTVTDDGTGKLVVSPTTDQVQLSFTNTYDANGEATITVTKAISGAEWPEGKTLTLTLAGAEGAPMPETTTATLDAVGSVSFEPIAYGLSDAGKNFTYTITEDGFGDGWTGSPTSITATVAVTDNGDGTLSTEVTYDPEDKTFTNTYEAEGEATIEAVKAISGAEWPEDGEITFTLAGTESAPMPAEGGEIRTLTEPGTATFGKIAYDESDAGKTYTYTITEDGFGEGWTGSGDITATVVVTDNGDGTLSTEVTYDPTDKTITNTYEAEGEAELEVIKELSGAAWPEGKTLTFTLSGEGGTLPEETTVELTEPGTATFDKITYTQEDMVDDEGKHVLEKEFTYTITEDGFGDGWTGSGDVTATVTVTDNGDGTLSTVVSYDPEDQIITNTYEAEGEAVLEAVKGITGAAWPKDKEGNNKTLTFTLDGEGGTLPEEKTETLTEPGTAAFDAIKYTEADMVDDEGNYVLEKTFTYTITEDGFGKGWTPTPGDVITATVVVTNNGDGTLSTEVSYDPKDDTITNVYKATGKVEIEATKELVGRDWLDGETFTFTLYDAEGEEIESIDVSKDDPVANFKAINYTEADAAKSFTYTIEETSNLPGGITKSGTVTVTVEVTDNGDGTLSTSADYTNNGTITNKYDAEGEITLDAIKELEGREWQEGETYTFTLYDAEGNVIDEQTVESNSTVTFDEIKYTEEDMVDENGNPVTEKIFEYTIVETTELPGGMTNSGEITATVTVVDNGDGTLTTSVEYDKDDTIINTYRSEGEAVIKAKKALEGRPWLDGEKYTFTLSASTEGAPMPEEGTTVEFTEDGEKSFGAIKYTQEDMLVDGKYATEKTYEYTISETSELPAGVTKSEDIRVTVKLTDNGDGTITADITYDPDNTITNTYKAKPVEATIDVTKTIDGYVSNVSGSSDSTFEFTLYDKDGKQVGDKITITTEDGKGKASFKAIEYDEAGTYNYTVKETVGDKAGYTYSTKTYPVTVTVTDNYKEAQLEASVSYGEDGTATSVDVVNEFDFTDVEVTLTLTKTIEDQSDSAPDSTFTFKLYKDSVSDENLVDTKKITTEDLKGSVEFDKLKFEASGEYTYIVVEEAGDEAGFTYDTKEHTYKIIIDDDFEAAVLKVNEDSTLEAEITNVYKAKETSTILQVNKEINDTSDSAYETTFTFTLTGPDGYTDETSVKGAGTAEFKAITYKKAGTYEYTIKETAGDAAGYEYDTKEYKVTVTVEDQNGQLIATAAYMDETGAAKTELSITNTYNPEDASIVLEATKKVVDKTGGATAKTFKFELLDADGKVIDTATREGAGKVTFGEITYEKVGTYNYSIREVAGTDKGYEYDTNEYKVTVEVTDAGDGNLKAAVTSEGGVTITNTYTAEPVKVGVEVTKKLTGRDLRDGEFTFQLKKGDEVVAEAANDADGKVAFKKLTFKKAGTYEYTVAEVAGDLRGVKYDKNEYPVTITVTDDGEGALKAEITSEDVTFSNKFTEKKRDITVTKVWDDEDNLDGTRPETVTINLMADGEKVKSAKLSEENDWTYTFEGLNYYNADDSKIKYTVEEKKVSGYKVKITGTVKDGFTVTNTHVPGEPTPVSYDPPVIKYVEGDEAPEDDEFTFKLEAISGPEGEDIPMPEGSEDGVKEMSTVAGEEKEFGDIEFTVPGTYVYEITEVDTELEGYTYDESVYTLTFVVTRNDANELEYELTIEKDGEEYDSDVSAFEFTNEYEEPAKPVKPAKTGDTTMIYNYVILFGASIMLLLALLLRRRNAHK